MTDKNPTPLDFEEVVSDETTEAPISPAQKRLQNFEFVPLITLAIGLFFKLQSWPYATEILIAGGTLSALLYLFFSWFMFRVGKYRPLEVILSILCGLAFSTGIFAILFRMQDWERSELLVSYGLKGIVFFLFVSIVLFAFHLKDKRASVFYRNLISRLLIFTVLLLYISRIYF